MFTDLAIINQLYITSHENSPFVLMNSPSFLFFLRKSPRNVCCSSLVQARGPNTVLIRACKSNVFFAWWGGPKNFQLRYYLFKATSSYVLHVTLLTFVIMFFYSSKLSNDFQVCYYLF